MLALDLDKGRLYHDNEIKDRLAASRPFGDWVRNITVIDDLVKPDGGEPVEFGKEELRRRQNGFGVTLEDLELILPPMVEDAREAVGSMGDDTPLAVLSDRYRGLHHFFRQNFSQVTNPPIDSLRERRVMTLKTRLGNLGNILDEDESQCRLLQLESPILSNAEFEAMRAYLGDTAVDVDCTFEADGGEAALRDALQRICRAAEDGVRGGCEHVVLSDKNVSADRVPIPMILGTAAVHSHLVHQKLRTFTSINVRAGECLDVHYFSLLIGVGATTVNAYLAQESIADRQARGLFGDMPLVGSIAGYLLSVDFCLLLFIL
jgi:glutamate synthase (NADPH/NADH) large chain